jgi:choline-glycine betaine transporter
MSSQYKYAAVPIAVVASVAVWSMYTSGKKPLSLETTKRKEYWERMKVEERKQQEKKAEVEQKDEKADEPEESSSKDDSKSDDSESKGE